MATSMESKMKKWFKDKNKMKEICCGGDNGGFGYFLGFIGAAIYYIGGSTGFWGGLLALLKAFVWPAFLVLEVLKFVGA